MLLLIFYALPENSYHREDLTCHLEQVALLCIPIYGYSIKKW